MPRLIDVESLKLPDEYQIGPFDGPYYRGIGNGWNSALQACREHIDSTPTISPDEVRGVGKWIKRFDGPYGRGRTYCSSCGKHSGIGGIKQTPPYCPNCGAKMEASEDA